jgi:hypothetical protein
MAITEIITREHPYPQNMNELFSEQDDGSLKSTYYRWYPPKDTPDDDYTQVPSDKLLNKFFVTFVRSEYYQAYKSMKDAKEDGLIDMTQIRRNPLPGHDNLMVEWKGWEEMFKILLETEPELEVGAMFDLGPPAFNTNGTIRPDSYNPSMFSRFNFMKMSPIRRRMRPMIIAAPQSTIYYDIDGGNLLASVRINTDHLSQYDNSIDGDGEHSDINMVDSVIGPNDFQYCAGFPWVAFWNYGVQFPGASESAYGPDGQPNRLDTNSANRTGRLVHQMRISTDAEKREYDRSMEAMFASEGYRPSQGTIVQWWYHEIFDKYSAKLKESKYFKAGYFARPLVYSPQWQHQWGANAKPGYYYEVESKNFGVYRTDDIDITPSLGSVLMHWLGEMLNWYRAGYTYDATAPMWELDKGDMNSPFAGYLYGLFPVSSTSPAWKPIFEANEKQGRACMLYHIMKEMALSNSVGIQLEDIYVTYQSWINDDEDDTVRRSQTWAFEPNMRRQSEGGLGAYWNFMNWDYPKGFKPSRPGSNTSKDFIDGRVSSMVNSFKVFNDFRKPTAPDLSKWQSGGTQRYSWGFLMFEPNSSLGSLQTFQWSLLASVQYNANLSNKYYEPTSDSDIERIGLQRFSVNRYIPNNIREAFGKNQDSFVYSVNAPTMYYQVSEILGISTKIYMQSGYGLTRASAARIPKVLAIATDCINKFLNDQNYNSLAFKRNIIMAINSTITDDTDETTAEIIKNLNSMISNSNYLVFNNARVWLNNALQWLNALSNRMNSIISNNSDSYISGFLAWNNNGPFESDGGLADGLALNRLVAYYRWIIYWFTYGINNEMNWSDMDIESFENFILQNRLISDTENFTRGTRASVPSFGIVHDAEDSENNHGIGFRTSPFIDPVTLNNNDPVYMAVNYFNEKMESFSDNVLNKPIDEEIFSLASLSHILIAVSSQPSFSATKDCFFYSPVGELLLTRLNFYTPEYSDSTAQEVFKLGNRLLLATNNSIEFWDITNSLNDPFSPAYSSNVYNMTMFQHASVVYQDELYFLGKANESSTYSIYKVTKEGKMTKLSYPTVDAWMNDEFFKDRARYNPLTTNVNTGMEASVFVFNSLPIIQFKFTEWSNDEQNNADSLRIYHKRTQTLCYNVAFNTFFIMPSLYFYADQKYFKQMSYRIGTLNNFQREDGTRMMNYFRINNASFFDMKNDKVGLKGLSELQCSIEIDAGKHKEFYNKPLNKEMPYDLLDKNGNLIADGQSHVNFHFRPNRKTRIDQHRKVILQPMQGDKQVDFCVQGIGAIRDLSTRIEWNGLSKFNHIWMNIT